MDSFAKKNAATTRPVFTEAAARMGINPLVIEKDFWACWSLKRVFEMTDIPGHIFKGGTSLSKVYRVIGRFSEDIDISIDRTGLGFSEENDPANPELSGKKREKLCDALKKTCSSFIENEILPRFQHGCKEMLGEAVWAASMDGRDPDRLSILFNYPRSLSEYVLGAYLTPSVVLEFGCRGDQWPANNATVRSFVAEQFPGLLAEPDVSVRAMAGERTFWEKVTLIHAENHRPSSATPRERLSRHYSDIAALYNTALGVRATADTKLLQQVVEHKRIFFRSGWANYDTAKPARSNWCPIPNWKKNCVMITNK